jgi:hypothetical protein
MPTFEVQPGLWRDYGSQTNQQRQAFQRAVAHFIDDLRAGVFRAGLRVKGVQGAPGIFEMTWAPDGRATFEFGTERGSGPHVIWRRIGTHRIFARP